MNIYFESGYRSPAELGFEVVERKGIGHPDTVADGIAESISVQYSKYCLENFGVVLHHNVDKVNILGGLANVEWGSDKMLKPLKIILNGRISASFGGQQIPVEEICTDAAKSFLKRALPNLDIVNDVRYQHYHTTYSRNPLWFNPSSIEDLPEYKKLFANDTSAVASGAPLTLVEKLVLIIEGFFYTDEQVPKYMECGQDIKVMAVRKAKEINITVCFPVLLKYCENASQYWVIFDRIHNDLLEFLKR